MKGPRRGAVATPTILTLACWLAAASCDSTEIGQPCGNAQTLPAVTNPVDGEAVVVEVVRVERDAQCQALQCITHGGLPAYCSQPCDGATRTGGPCSSTSDCTSPDYCYNGVCQDDDCPAGYWCRTVQDVGPLALQKFCVRQNGCASNVDCEDLGRLACRKIGCYDSCWLNAASATCSTHNLACSPFEQLQCTCDICASDAERVCHPPQVADPWPGGVVEYNTVCLEKDFPL